jgi:hypothetical protein
VDLRAQEAAGEELLVSLGAVGGVGPHLAGGVVRVDQFGQQRPVAARRIGERPAADKAMPAVDADMIFVTKGRDREINARGAVRARLSFGGFDRPARIAVLLPQLGWLLRPLCRDAAFFDVTLLAIAIAAWAPRGSRHR